MADDLARQWNLPDGPACDVVPLTAGTAFSALTAPAYTYFRGLLVTVAGNVNITTLAGRTVTIPVTVGFNSVACTALNTSGTTATGIFGLA